MSRNRYSIVIGVVVLLALLPLVARAAIDLASFEGWWQNNHVMLEWETGDEGSGDGISGFDVYRDTDPDPTGATKLNTSIIAAQQACTPGESGIYQFEDVTADVAQGPYHYWLASYSCTSPDPELDPDAHRCVLIGDFVDDTGSTPPDGKLTVEDLVYLAGKWGQTTGLPNGADNDGDGKVTIIELSRSAMHLGTACFE